MILRALLALCLYFTPAQAFWQSRSQQSVSGGFTPSCTESSNFFARATTVTVGADKTNYDTLICGIVSDGDFSKLDVLKIWAAPDRTAAVLNLIQNAYNDTENGTVNFTAYQGYTGDGSTFYLDSGFRPDTASSPQYVLNSAVMGVYVQTNTTSGGANAENMGASNVGTAYLTTFSFGNANWIVNNSATNRAIATATSQGLWVATRTSINDVALYRNGNTTPIDSSAANVSDFVPRANFWFFARNGAGGPTSSQMSAGFLGSGLSSAAMARISARINTFMTAYGINVY